MHGSTQPSQLTSEPSSVQKLQSKDLEEVLDLIDQLRSGGTDRYVDVPQIVVCGDQSSGKSSVLEALSEISFPWRDTVCTRFAIELILRRAKDASIAVSIYPDDERPSGEKERLRKFKSHNQGLEQFSDIVKSAEEHIDLGRTGQMFSRDVLRIEVSGPTQPHLTLVDLPGLYHAADEHQNAEGVQFVEDLVWSYMQKSRSLILAVISAKSDIALQKVTSFTRRVDPEGRRTMGIITKPDTLSADSDMEQSFLKLARNERLNLRLGWHVLKNRSFEQRDFSIAQRHDAESDFFKRRVWSSLPRSQVGIDSLRSRLSIVLKGHILSQMSGFRAEIRSSLAEAESDLEKLGLPRKTVLDQRHYLLASSERFSSLIRDAVNGNYSDSFFEDAMSDIGLQKRLRAVIQNRLLDFAQAMRDRGEHRKIVSDEYKIKEGENCVSRSDFADEVKQRMRRSRGRELPGTFNPLVIGELFFLQARPWESIVAEYTDLILEETRQAAMLILKQSLDDKSIEGLLNHVMNASFTSLDEALRKKIRELLEPQQHGHPITYNHNFIKHIQEARKEHHRAFVTQQLKSFFPYPEDPSQVSKYSFAMTRLVDALVDDDESEVDQFACSEAIDCMLAYYKVARKKFVDDFSSLAVEKCLLEPLLGIYSPRTVNKLDADVVEDIAREDEITRLERDRLEEKIEVLRMSIGKLIWLDRSSAPATGGSPALNDDKSQPIVVEMEVSEMPDPTTQPEQSPQLVPRDQSSDPLPIEILQDIPLAEDWTLTSPDSVKKRRPKHAKAAFYEQETKIFG